MSAIDSLVTCTASTPRPNYKVRSKSVAAPEASAHGQMHILSISPTAEDHEALRRVMDGFMWQLSAVATCAEGLTQLCRDQVSVIFCESVLEDGTWKDILNHLKNIARAPLLIVTSRLADEHLWAEVLNMGGFDVLAKPFSDQEVSHVLTTASLSGLKTPARSRTAGAD